MSDDELRIFVTTDNHVGFAEHDPVRSEDASRSLAEAMNIALKCNSDLVVQGGDLFHKNRPDKQAMYDVVSILRRSCLGDKPIEFEVLGHGALVGEKDFNHVNYYDSNINVSLPVFAISGNHDDAGGANMLSPLDILSAMGLVNHFGKVDNNEMIEVRPILIRKGEAKLALYGIANVRDERLYRAFRNRKVRFLRPAEGADEWFNILVVHQNRSAHVKTGYLPEDFLPAFLDLVIWGHEHQSIPDPVENARKGFRIIQPGSSVATSLHESEASPKYVVCLKIGPQKRFSYTKFPLTSVRPFAITSVILSSDLPTKIKSLANGPDPGEARPLISTWLLDVVDRLIAEASSQWHELTPRPDGEQCPLPLVRIRCEYTGFEVENPVRFGRKFEGRVANPSDVLMLYKAAKPKSSHLNSTSSGINRLREADKDQPVSVMQLVRHYLRQHNLAVMSQEGTVEALSRFVEKDDKNAIKQYLEGSIGSALRRIIDGDDGGAHKDTGNEGINANSAREGDEAEIPDSQDENDGADDMGDLEVL